MLSKIVGGGVEQSYIYPLYGGQIILSGIVVACTCIIYDEITAIKKDIEEIKGKDNDKDNDKDKN